MLLSSSFAEDMSEARCEALLAMIEVRLASQEPCMKHHEAAAAQEEREERIRAVEDSTAG